MTASARTTVESPPRLSEGAAAPVADWRVPSAEYYRCIVEGMTCALMTVDRAGRMTLLNEQARAILDLGGGDFGGRACQEVLAHCPRLAEAVMEAFRMSSPPSRAEMQIRGRDGRERTIGFSVSMIAPSGGAVEGAALFFKDLTKVEERHERERLRDRLAALGEMASQMAHEIRNPATSIHVWLSLVERRAEGRQEIVDLLGKIANEVGRIETVIASCLDYARPLAPNLQRVETAALLDEAAEVARRRFGPSAAAVATAYGRDLPALRCDRELILQTLVNILVNAQEAMAGRGTVTLSADAPEPAGDPASLPRRKRPAQVGGRALAGAPDLDEFARVVRIRIADTGPGIPQDLIEKIFYPFFTTKRTGSGIGLAMARKVIESHGGWIDVQSECGNGATFTLRLPAL